VAGPVGCRGGLGNYREATNGDIRELQKVAFAAWSHAYRGIYEPSTIRRKVSAHYSTTALEAAIEKAKAGETFFFVTSDEGGIVGYANGGRISSPWMDPSKTGGKSYDISLGADEDIPPPGGISAAGSERRSCPDGKGSSNRGAWTGITSPTTGGTRSRGISMPGTGSSEPRSLMTGQCTVLSRRSENLLRHPKNRLKRRPELTLS